MTDNKVVENIVSRMVQTVCPVQIVLFGSSARGDRDEDSDLDFLVVMPNGTHRRKTARALYRALYGVGQAKDIVVATVDDLERHGNDPGYIYESAITQGTEIYREESH